MVRFMNVGMVDKDINRIVCAKSSKRNSEKGFTLVELIVVLVILAILAAAIVPALLGYTDHAKKKKYIATAEECLKASQAVLSDRYNDSSNRLTKDQRYAAAGTANVDPEGTTFKVWTARRLEAGITPVTNDNIGAFTIVAAIYSTGAEKDGVDTSDFKYVFYDGKEYTYYDTRDEAYAAAAGMGYLDSDSTTSTRINMWPFKDDAASTDNSIAQTETWEDDKTEISKTVTFHLAHVNFVHGTVFKYDNGEVSEDKDIEVTFKKNATLQPESEQCENLTNGSVVTDENGNVYTLSLEEGFDELKWSAVEGEKGTLEWTKTNNTLLNEIFNGNVSEFYATTTKKTITKEVTFKALNINTLHFNPGMKDSITVNFTGFSNRYDIGKWSVNKAAFDNGEMSGVESLTNYGTVLSSREFSNGYNLAGWAFNDSESATGYEMNLPVRNEVKEYSKEEDLWKKVFSVNSETVTFTGIMIQGKTLILKADDNTFFGAESDDVKELRLISAYNELVASFDLSNASKDNFDDYKNKRIAAKIGSRFIGWAEEEGSQERVLYNDNIVSIKDYALHRPEAEVHLYAVSTNASRAKVEGGSGNNTSYAAYNVFNYLAWGKRNTVTEINRIDDYQSAINYLNGKGDIFDNYTTMDNNEIKGNINISKSRDYKGGHSAVYTIKSGGAIERFAILWDGVDEEYPVPIFAYSTCDSSGKRTINWFSAEPNPDVDGSLYQLFNGFSSCNFSDSKLEQWNYSGCTNTAQMFKGCNGLTSNENDLKFRSWDLSSVKSIANMFENCKNPDFKAIDFSGVDLESLTSMSDWVKDCNSIDTIIFDNVNSPNLTDVSTYISNKGNLKNFSGRNWQAQSLTSLKDMFKDCTKLDVVDLSGAQFPAVTTMNGAFKGAFKVTADSDIGRQNRVDFSNVDFSNLIDASEMFKGSKEADDLYYIKEISFEGADIAKLENCSEMFLHQAELETINFNTKTTFSPVLCNNMFDWCTKLSQIYGVTTAGDSDLKMLTDNTENMNNMFWGCESLTDGAFLQKFNFEEVKSAEKMFAGAGFTTIDLHGKNFNELVDAYSMFGGYCYGSVYLYPSATYINLSNCNFPKLTRMMSHPTNVRGFFEGNTNIENINFSGCNIPNVESFSRMFYGCTSLKLDNSDFSFANSNKVNAAKYMFYGCTGITTDINIGSFSSTVESMENMFQNCSNMTGVNNLRIDSATNINYLFDGCSNLERVTLSGGGMKTAKCPLGNSSVSNVFRNTKISDLTIKDITFENFSTSISNKNDTGSGLHKILASAKEVKFNNELTLRTITIKNVAAPEIYTGQQLFYNAQSVTKIDIDNLVLGSYVLSIKQMFANCYNLSDLNWKMSSDGNQDGLLKLDNLLAAGDTSHVFDYCYRIEKVDLSTIDTSECRWFGRVFRCCFSLEEIKFGEHFDTQNAWDMQEMFDSCYSLETVDISHFDTGSISQSSYLNNMFGTSTNDSVNNKTQSDLTTIYASESTLKAFTRYQNQNVFGSKLNTLNGHVISSISDSNKYKSRYGRFDQGSTIGYFTEKE